MLGGNHGPRTCSFSHIAGRDSSLRVTRVTEIFPGLKYAYRRARVRSARPGYMQPAQLWAVSCSDHGCVAGREIPSGCSSSAQSEWLYASAFKGLVVTPYADGHRAKLRPNFRAIVR